MVRGFLTNRRCVMRKEGERLVFRGKLLAYIYQYLGGLFPNAITDYEGNCTGRGDTVSMHPAGAPPFLFVFTHRWVRGYPDPLPRRAEDLYKEAQEAIGLIKVYGDIAAFAVQVLPYNNEGYQVLWGVLRKEDVISRYMLGDKKGATTKTATETAAGITPKPPLPRWKSHKVVEAFKIREIRRKTYIPTLGEIFSLLGGDDSDPVSVDVLLEYISKHSPKPGGYYVRYEDGY
ncbi:MAG: hypothetical protein ABIJ57_03140, partial [Pseudomonadota bacterium]